MIAGLVFCLSAATLAFQVLLVRVFAIELFHHFASMAIGVAMLGSGVAGTVLALRPRFDPARARAALPLAALVGALALGLTPAAIDVVALDPSQLTWRPGAWLRLATLYGVLAAPFALAALPVLLALAAVPAQPGRIYGASFVGAGTGALGALAALDATEPSRALALPAVVAACGAVLAAGAIPSRNWRRRLPLVVSVVLLVGLAVRPVWDLDLIAYKDLPQVEALPQARRVAQRSDRLGWVVAVAAPGFRSVPGLSLAYQGPLPEQVALFVDGDLAGTAATWVSDVGPAAVDWVPEAVAHSLGKRPRVLVLGPASWWAVAAALAAGAERIRVVERNAALAGLVDSIAGWPAGRVERVIADPRAAVAADDSQYDLIVLGPRGGPGGSGTSSATEDYLDTLDAYRRILDLLAPGGMLAITRWLDLPVRAGARTILTAAAALRTRDPAALGSGLAVVRGWATVTVLVKPAGFSSRDRAALRTWAEGRWFDLDWMPDEEEERFPFNAIDDPSLREAARAVVAGPETARQFVASHPFQVSPVTDRRPYPDHFQRASAIPDLLRRPPGEWLPVAEWGHLTLLATLVQATLIGGLCLLLPTVARAGRPAGPGSLRVLAYFGLIGFAYLAVELAVIQQLTLLLGHPVLAVSTVLTVLLVASGIGSAVSDRITADRAPHLVLLPAALASATAVGLLPLVQALVGTATGVRLLALGLILGPLGLAMGLPFPLGLRTLASGGGRRVAWAWAANAFASVVAAPLGALLALEAGSPALAGLGGGAYLLASSTLAAARRARAG